VEALFYSQPGVASLVQPIVVLTVAIAVIVCAWRRADP
jgi:hypothetical protein